MDTTAAQSLQLLWQTLPAMAKEEIWYIGDFLRVQYSCINESYTFNLGSVWIARYKRRVSIPSRAGNMTSGRFWLI